MARAALRDDLFDLHRAMTDDVLREAGEAGLDGWTAANQSAIDRTLRILDDIRAGGSFDLVTLPVALREIRALIDSTGPV